MATSKERKTKSQPLHRAILLQDESQIFSLARPGMDPLQIGGAIVAFGRMRVDPRGQQITPLLVAVHFGELELTRCLIEEGAELNTGVLHCMGPLCLALDYKNYAIAELLVRAGADLSRADLEGKTPLHRVLQEDPKGDDALKMINLLLDSGARASAPDLDGHSPLHLAARVAALPACKALLSHGASYNLRTPSGATPQALAQDSRAPRAERDLVIGLLASVSRVFNMVVKKQVKVLEELEKLDEQELLCYINCVNRKGNTLLMMALDLGCKHIIDGIMGLRLRAT